MFGVWKEDGGVGMLGLEVLDPPLTVASLKLGLQLRCRSSFPLLSLKQKCYSVGSVF